MLNKSCLIIFTGLLSILVLSTLLHFKMRSPGLYVLLAISFIIVGAGILFGFIKMVTDNKE